MLGDEGSDPESVDGVDGADNAAAAATGLLAARTPGSSSLPTLPPSSSAGLKSAPSSRTGPTPAPDEEIPCRDCAEGVLVWLYEFVQDGANFFWEQERDRDEDNSVYSDNDDGDVGGEQMDPGTFLRRLTDRAAEALVLLEEEGSAPPDALELARGLSERCRSLAGGGAAFDRASFEALLLGEAVELLRRVRPVDLDLLLQLLRAGQDAGDTMQDKDVLLLIGQTG